MSVHKPDAALIARRTTTFPDGVDDITSAPMPLPTRHFDLPPVLHGVTLALFLVYLGVMGTAFAGSKMPIVLAICAISVIGMFAVPAKFAMMKPHHSDGPLSMADFARDGIDCHTGRVTAAQASVQVLILPVLILLWGVAVAIIAASVG